jgi:Helix-turn-helix of DDE superfamily endonuclease
VQARPTEFLDVTSVTPDELQLLVPPFEAAFQAQMRAWRLDGKPRAARRFSVYQTCPLPTPEDRLFFILTYVQTYALQVVQGRLFGMRQSKAHQRIHVLVPVLQAALRTLGDTPARSLAALAQRLGVSEAEVAPGGVPLAEACPPVALTPSAPASGQTAPRLPMTAPNGASSAPKMLLNRRGVIAEKGPHGEKHPAGQCLSHDPLSQ